MDLILTTKLYPTKDYVKNVLKMPGTEKTLKKYYFIYIFFLGGGTILGLELRAFTLSYSSSPFL
jgi:hypothetical protein